MGTGTEWMVTFVCVQLALQPLLGARQHKAAAQQGNRLCVAGGCRNFFTMVQYPPSRSPW